MAFCKSGTCDFTLTSKTGLPQCRICKRVNLAGKSRVPRKSKAKTRSKKTTTQRQPSTGGAWVPNSGDLRLRGNMLSQKQKKARERTT